MARVRRLSVLTGALFALAGAVVAREAHAEPPSGLTVVATADARACGDADLLRAKIAERLGRDPFAEPGSTTGGLRVSYARDRLAWTAEITLLDSAGKPTGARALVRDGATCQPLVAAVAFTVAVLLEELTPPAPPPSPPAPPPAGPVWPPDPPAPPPAAPAPPRTTYVDGAIGAMASVGTAPAPAVGAEIAIGVDVSRLRIELAGRFSLPASSGGDVAVRTRLVHGKIAPCYGWPMLSACLVAAVGSITGEAIGDRIASSSLDGRVYAAAGVGALSRVFLGERVFLRGSLDALFPFSRVGFDVGDLRVWTLPLASGTVSVGIGARLP